MSKEELTKELEATLKYEMALKLATVACRRRRKYLQEELRAIKPKLKIRIAAKWMKVPVLQFMRP